MYQLTLFDRLKTRVHYFMRNFFIKRKLCTFSQYFLIPRFLNVRSFFFQTSILFIHNKTNELVSHSVSFFLFSFFFFFIFRPRVQRRRTRERRRKSMSDKKRRRGKKKSVIYSSGEDCLFFRRAFILTPSPQAY